MCRWQTLNFPWPEIMGSVWGDRNLAHLSNWDRLIIWHVDKSQEITSFINCEIMESMEKKKDKNCNDRIKTCVWNSTALSGTHTSLISFLNIPDLISSRSMNYSQIVIIPGLDPTKSLWCFPWSMLHPYTEFCGNPTFWFCVILPTNI